MCQASPVRLRATLAGMSPCALALRKAVLAETKSAVQGAAHMGQRFLIETVFEISQDTSWKWQRS